MIKKKYGILILFVVAVVVAGALVVALNVKTVKISSGVKYRVTFGKMSAAEVARVVAIADRELMPARKYAFARDAYAGVVAHHRGEWRDDAFLGMARTYLAEGRRRDAYPWLARVVRESPRGSAVESGAFDRAVTAELAAILARPPLDYYWGVRYLNLLAAAGSAAAPAWRRKFQDIVETPFTLTAAYDYEKELSFVVRETATRDARATALFYAREHIPSQLVAALRKKVDFGPVVPPDKIAAFVEERTEYVSRLEKVGKATAEDEGVAKVRLEKARAAKGLGELPAEWAEAFLAAEAETGWVAAASVVGELKDVTIAEVLTFARVDPFTGAPAAR